jgi:hypothetical protein
MREKNTDSSSGKNINTIFKSVGDGGAYGISLGNDADEERGYLTAHEE